MRRCFFFSVGTFIVLAGVVTLGIDRVVLNLRAESGPKRMLDLLKRIQQRISYIALLIEYPTALTHLVQLVSVSSWIAAFLSRHPVLLDELLDPRALYPPPGLKPLQSDLIRRMAAVTDESTPPDNAQITF